MRKSTVAHLAFTFVMLASVNVPQLKNQASAAPHAKTVIAVKHVVKKKKHFVPHISPKVMAMWRKVNICEEGGRWNVRGYLYSGGLGITNWNWVQYGGQALFGPAWKATPAMQMYIAQRIQKKAHVASYVPDQYGCGIGW